MDISPIFIIAAIVLLIGIGLLVKGIRVVQQSEAIVVERLGSFHRTLDAGISFIIPFVERARPITMRRYRARGGENIAVVEQETRIDRRETVLDFPDQPVVTSDNVSVHVNGALYFQIVDPKKAVYQVENFVQAIEVLAKTSLRSEIGKMELDKLFESRNEVNAALQQTMDEVGDKWGVKVTRVEIQDIAMPSEVEEAMRQQMTAERKRRATVTEANGDKEAQIQRAEGEKQAAIAKAEGDKTAAIERAEGDKESAKKRAEGEQSAIEQVMAATGEAGQKEAIGYLLGLEYIRKLPEMANQGDRVFIPYEASSLLSGLGAFSELGGQLNVASR
jgi:regulator of protease activity HflC (stomatin/prohibitin superfamily)